MANEQTDYSNQGYFNVTPDNVQKDIVYPTPQDNQQPDIPLHNKTNSQAIANNMNYVYEVISNLAGLTDDEDLDDIIEKVNLPVREDGSIDYGREGLGLANAEDGVNKTEWVDFATAEELENEKNDLIGQGELQNPIGQIVMYAGTSAPAGWQVCNGDPAHANLKSELNINNVPDLRNRVPVGYDARYYSIGHKMGSGKTESIATPHHNHSASSGGFNSSHYHAETNHNHGVILGYRTDVRGGGTNWSAVYTGGIDIATDHRAGSTGWATHDHAHGISVDHAGSSWKATIMSHTTAKAQEIGVYRTAVNFIIFHGGT